MPEEIDQQDHLEEAAAALARCQGAPLWDQAQTHALIAIAELLRPISAWAERQAYPERFIVSENVSEIQRTPDGLARYVSLAGHEHRTNAELEEKFGPGSRQVNPSTGEQWWVVI